MWKGGGSLLSVYKDKDQWHAKRTECPVPKKKVPSPLLAEHSQSHSSRVGRWSVLGQCFGELMMLMWLRC